MKINKVLVLGSGAIKIGEAGEFDYSGSQCLKALKEEKIKSVLVNPNIATIQTSAQLADKIYFLPVTADFVAKIIKKERPDAILLSFGGQTALNCGLELAEKGILKKYKVQVLGTPVAAIQATEDRELFVQALNKIGLLPPKSLAVKSLASGIKALETIKFPLILRVGFALGGLGSTLVKNRADFEPSIKKALSGSSQVLIEEYLGGWKEIEYEVVRDRFDNCITVCNMENFDPMGVHTGESIVVAPSQTLTDFEYQNLRQDAIKFIKSLGIIGECNIQYAVNPEKFEYRVIEVNARLSRSSALASKATGYPLAFVATKLALGYSLFEIENKITQKTKSFFEPALDYLALKFPRWDLEKFKNVRQELGSEMKSVGEVMALGRNFNQVLQKAIRMLNIGQNGLFDSFYQDFLKIPKTELMELIKTPTPKRVFVVAAALTRGILPETINKLSGIDMWFISQIKEMVDFHKNPRDLRQGKILGFSDSYFGSETRKIRQKLKILPVVKQIDTVAAEFPAKTNYLYLTYSGKSSDTLASKNKKVLILGSGPYCIGSSVEFDWCSVNAAWELQKQGFETIMVNCNPETVSTDFDIGSKLYFEELSEERVLDIIDVEKPDFLLLSFGGQIPNTLSSSLKDCGIPILGTSVTSIDIAEDRHKFAGMLDKLKIGQPDWRSFSNKSEAFEYAQKIGFPVLVRPSYVLSGSAMFVAFHLQDLEYFLQRSLAISTKYPLVVSKFVQDAIEVDIDGIAQKGKLLVSAICEHLENAGVHSGDATLVYPAQNLPLPVKSQLDLACKKIVKELNITGPFNIQFLVKNGVIGVIECNLRASRSFPFVSKISGINFVSVGIKAMLGKPTKFVRKKISWVGVKTPQFSFTRLKGADPVLRVEMSSTGEVACLGKHFLQAYLTSLIAANFKLPKNNILLSIGGDEHKQKFLESARKLESKFKLFATSGTHAFLMKNNIKSTKVYKEYEKTSPSVVDLITDRTCQLVISISNVEDLKRGQLQKELTDGYQIRRAAADYNTSLITNMEDAIIFCEAVYSLDPENLPVKSWDEYL